MTPTPPRFTTSAEARAAGLQEADYLNGAFAREQDGERIGLEVGPWSLLILTCGLRLAAAHPGMTELEGQVLLAYADIWSRFYTGTPAEEMAAAGTMPVGVYQETEPI